MLNENRNKILVIDDDGSNRRFVTQTLSSAGYWVLNANRFRKSDSSWKGDEDEEFARNLLKTHFFHVAVIDLSLINEDPEDRTGIRILDALNSLKEGTKSIILTGYGTPRDVRELWKKHQAYDYLDKDNIEMILEKISDAIKDAKLATNALLDGNLTYYELIKQPKLAEIVVHLGSRSEQEIRTVIEGALRPYFPYDTKYITTSFKTLTIQDNQLSYFEILLWSRYLGNAISLCVGSRQVCEYRVMIAEHSHKKKGSDFVVFEESPRDSIVALVEYAPMKYPGDQPDNEFE